MTEISIFDLPALYKKPTEATLLAAIDSLAVEIPSFEGPSASSHNLSDRDSISYLTSIISSPLSWLPDDDARDAIWSAASLRLNERAGRSVQHLRITKGYNAPSLFKLHSKTNLRPARPSRTRTLEIPSVCTSEEQLRIDLHEPTLTSDLLGHKTWVAGYLLSKRLQILGSDVPALSRHDATMASVTSPLVLELGSGTGLLGLALAHRMPSAELHLTDLPTIVPNLAANVERNFPVESTASPALNPKLRKAPIHVLSLDWNALPESSEALFCERTKSPVERAQKAGYDLIIAADVLYGAEHPPLIARAASHFLKPEQKARLVVEVPIRERAGGLVDMLKDEVEQRGLELRNSGEEEGWEEMGRDRGRVRCWWGVWGWAEDRLEKSAV